MIKPQEAQVRANRPRDEGDLEMSAATGFARETSPPITAVDSAHIAKAAVRARTAKAGMKEFPPFWLDILNECLWRRRDDGDDERIRLTPKAFAVLRYLVDHAGRLVTQDELIEAVWPDIFVQPEVLKGQILDIRRALGDRPKDPLFIETLPRRGYQFIAPIKDVSAEARVVLEQPYRKLVGRDGPLAQLGESLQRALRGQRQIVFVTGEPGIGKTALIDEFDRQVAEHALPLRTGHGQCVEGYGGTEAYYPMLEALGQLCRGLGGDSVVKILATQAPTWLVQFPEFVKREQREMLQRELLGATRERMLREIIGALETIASESPLLLVFSDLLWADHSTVGLISALARCRQSTRLMLIGTYPSPNVTLSDHPLKELKQDLLIHHLCHEIALQPLGEAEVAEYLAAESGGAEVPDGLAGLIYRHSEGNPLFMVAALEHMTQRGFVSSEDGTWKLTLPLEAIALEVPESLRQMIEIQIDRLNAEEQEVLEVASLLSVGRSQFVVALRAAIDDLERAAFEDVCERLSRRQCILRSSSPEKLPDGTVSACYEFVHALYREVCYRRMAPARRAKLHKQLGEWVEAHWGRANADAAWLASHFEQGADWLRAIKYLRLAADSAGRLFGPRQAAMILEHALELVNRLPDAERAEHEITILEELGKICNASLESRAILPHSTCG